tara:strand:- start:738 stop:1868 length:1131 start_codon:yes stop_codon:yes gene_type:complete
MKFELYINNHQYQTGIEDYIYSIKNIFSKNNKNINIVKTISPDVDVLFVIENFAKYPKELLKFKEKSKFKSTKICLIHTEFMNKEIYFNTFTTKEIFFRKCLLANLLSYLYQFEDSIFKKLIFYFLVLIYVIFGYILGFNFLEIKKRIIFALRDHNFAKFVNIANYNITLSDNLYNSLIKNTNLKNIFYLQDYIDINVIETFNSKDLNYNLLYLSGYKTPYRKYFIKKQNRNKYNNFIVKDRIRIDKYNFLKIEKIDFNLLFTKETEINKLINLYKKNHNINLSKFEIYIAQRRNWPYLSTTRIIRALRNESIPINVGKYNKSNYDKLCINIERLDSFVENYNCLIEKYFSNLESNIEKFNYKSDNLFNCFLKHVT